MILGEVHDNPAHHVFQTDVVAALDPAAIVFEMVTAEEARFVTPDLAADAEALSEALGWAESGWPDFALYYPLFRQAARAAVYGAEVPRDVARAAFAEGAAAVFPGDAARFGLSDPLDPDEQAMREAEQQEAHCNALPEDILPGFVEAQRLRDAALAEAALDALEGPWRAGRDRDGQRARPYRLGRSGPAGPGGTGGHRLRTGPVRVRTRGFRALRRLDRCRACGSSRPLRGIAFEWTPRAASRRLGRMPSHRTLRVVFRGPFRASC